MMPSHDLLILMHIATDTGLHTLALFELVVNSRRQQPRGGRRASTLAQPLGSTISEMDAISKHVPTDRRLSFLF